MLHSNGKSSHGGDATAEAPLALTPIGNVCSRPPLGALGSLSATTAISRTAVSHCIVPPCHSALLPPRSCPFARRAALGVSRAGRVVGRGCRDGMGGARAGWWVRAFDLPMAAGIPLGAPHPPVAGPWLNPGWEGVQQRLTSRISPSRPATHLPTREIRAGSRARARDQSGIARDAQPTK